MPWQGIDYEHWLRNHRLSEAQVLQPVFEAVENAFNAIDEAKRESGLVRINIHRDKRQKELGYDDSNEKQSAIPTVPVRIEITDNGIGLNTKTWRAFETVFTPHKVKTGGKGTGRLTYLLAFREAELESHYVEGDARYFRTVNIERSATGTSDGATIEDDFDGEPSTCLRLIELETRFHKAFPKKLETIAGRLVTHFFRRLSRASATKCVVRDDWDDSEIDLNQFCDQNFIIHQVTEPAIILGQQYFITHVKADRRVISRHEVLFCGNGRVVNSRELPQSFTTTRDCFTSQEKDFFYAAFLEGPELDLITRDDRLSFNMPEHAQTDELGLNTLSYQLFINEVGAFARTFLKDVLDPLEDAHKKRIEEFCKNNVIYRPLLKHRLVELHQIPVGLSDENFLEAISRIYHDWKAAVRARFKRFAASVRQNSEELSEYRERYREILNELSELAYHELATYVVDRKAVIDFLDQKLRLNEDGKFTDEDAVHDIFFPRRQTSEDLAWDESNLWLIDERLAYQQFVASDLGLKKQGLKGSQSTERPDVAVYYERFYDLTFAFAGGELPYTSVTLIEFKKPERKAYSETENPVSQVLRYIREIRKSKAITNDRHTFRIEKDSPIHVYVICHLVEELQPYLEPYTTIQTPDGQGVMFHAPTINTMFQFITFEKLISDAKKRNDVFFRKLGIDNNESL